jgi:hypothetical protein
MLTLVTQSSKGVEKRRGGQVALHVNASETRHHIVLFTNEANRNFNAEKNEFVANYICNVGPGALNYKYSPTKKGELSCDFFHILMENEVETNYIPTQLIQKMIAKSIKCSQPLTQCRASWKSSGFDTLTLELDMTSISTEEEFEVDVALSDLKVCYKSPVGLIIIQPLVSFVHRKPKKPDDGLGTFIFGFREHLAPERHAMQVQDPPQQATKNHQVARTQNGRKQRRMLPY